VAEVDGWRLGRVVGDVGGVGHAEIEGVDERFQDFRRIFGRICKRTRIDE